MIETIVILAVLVIVTDAVILWMYVTPALSRMRAQRALASHCAATGTLCLTYDDGPGTKLTPALLEIFRNADAKATFFLLGMRAEAAPAVATAVRSQGHDVGCHSKRHLNAWKSPIRSRADVRDGYESLAPWLPPQPLFRPPHGKLTSLTSRIARRHGSRIGWWTIDSGDTWDELPELESVISEVDFAGGGVILMHDFDRNDDDAAQRAEFVVSLTRSLLDLAQSRGWRVVSLSQLLREIESPGATIGGGPREHAPIAAN